MPDSTRGGHARLVAILVALLLVLGTSACVAVGGSTRIGSPPYTQGSGRTASETRALQPFHAIEVAQGVSVVMKAGTIDSATVSFDDNLLAMVGTTIAGDTLRVGIVGNVETRLQPRVEIVTTGSLASIVASAAASIDVGTLNASSLSVHASTAASVHAAGRATHLDVTVEDASTADLGDLAATDATVRISTASRATIRADEAVRGSCTLASTLELASQPRTQAVTTDMTSSIRGH